MNARTQIIIAGISGLSAVALGAFGAHGLKKILSPENLEIYKTGISYHLIHSVVLLAIALNTAYDFTTSFLFFVAGILLFSFSLYAYSISGIKLFAIITPFGGVSLIIGWLMLIIKVIKTNSI